MVDEVSRKLCEVKVYLPPCRQKLTLYHGLLGFVNHNLIESQFKRQSSNHNIHVFSSSFQGKVSQPDLIWFENICDHLKIFYLHQSKYKQHWLDNRQLNDQQLKLKIESNSIFALFRYSKINLKLIILLLQTTDL